MSSAGNFTQSTSIRVKAETDCWKDLQMTMWSCSLHYTMFPWQLSHLFEDSLWVVQHLGETVYNLITTDFCQYSMIMTLFTGNFQQLWPTVECAEFVPVFSSETDKQILILALLNPDIPYLCQQCRSRSVCFWRSQLIWICTVCHYLNLYQQSGSSNLKINSGSGILIYSAWQELRGTDTLSGVATLSILKKVYFKTPWKQILSF